MHRRLIFLSLFFLLTFNFQLFASGNSGGLKFSNEKCQYVKIATNDDIFNPTQGTLECWFKLTKQDCYNGLVGKAAHRFAKGHCSFGFYINAKNGLTGIVGTKDKLLALSSLKVQRTVSAGFWHHAALTWNDKTVKLFLDGILVASAPWQFALGKEINFPLLFGAWNTAYRSNAIINEVRISDIERYSKNFTCPLKPFVLDTQTKGLWRLNGSLDDATGSPQKTKSVGDPIFVSDNPFKNSIVHNVEIESITTNVQLDKLALQRFPICNVPKIAGLKLVKQQDGQTPIGWDGASRVSLKLVGSGTQPLAKTQTWVARDAKNLFLWIECEEPLMNKLKHETHKSDNSAIWKDDCIELFFQVPGQSQYFWIAINTLGVVCDTRYIDPVQYETSWNSGIEVIAKQLKKSWNLQLKIPLKSFGFKATDKINSLYGNICRERWTKAERSSYAMIGSGLHNTARFAQFNFVKAQQQVSKTKLAAALKGVIQDKRGPVSFVKIGIAQQLVYSDSKGQFYFPSLPVGKPLVINVMADDYKALQIKIKSLSKGDNRLLLPKIEHKNTQAYTGSLPAITKDFLVQPESFLQALVTGCQPRQKINSKLILSAARNEYESASFTIYTAKKNDLKNVSLTVSKLKNDNYTIAPENIQLRFIEVSYQRTGFFSGATKLVPIPLLLKKNLPNHLNAQSFYQFLVTIYTTPDTVAGTYQGQIEIKADNGKTKYLPIELTVYPVTLPRITSIVTGLYPSRSSSKLFFSDLRAHSMTTAYNSAKVPVIKTNGQLKANIHLVINYLKKCRDYGLTGPFPFTFDLRLKHEHPEYERIYKQGIAQILVEIKQQQLPEILFYPVDEPWGHKYQKFIKAASLIKQVPGAKVAVTYGLKQFLKDPKFQQLTDVLICSGYDDYMIKNPNKAALEQQLKQTKTVLWTYNNHQTFSGKNEAVWGRIIFGLYLWNSPLKGQLPWAYTSNPKTVDWHNPRNKKYGTSCAYVAPISQAIPVDKVYSTLRWEAARDGIDDLRCLDLLNSSIQQSTNDEAKKIAITFLKKLKQKMVKQMVVEDYLKYWNSTKFNTLKRQLLELIIKLQKK